MTYTQTQDVDMDDVYKEVNNAKVFLEIDRNDLIIRIPYIAGDAEDIKNIVENINKGV